MIIVTGSVTARPEYAAELREAALEHVARSRAEDGCLAHDVFVDCEQPLRFFFYEQWRDMDALKAHFRVFAAIAFVRALERMATAVEPVTIHEVTASTPLPQRPRDHGGSAPA